MFHNKLYFFKYQGTGNDFIILDQFDQHNSEILHTELISRMCNRYFGIGGDGLMLLRRSLDADFEMVYYNSDGNLSSMCGNGGRCIVALAYKLGYISEECNFLGPDGLHAAEVLDPKNIAISMNIPGKLATHQNDFIINTGSPHYIHFINENINHFDILKFGRLIRNSASFKSHGINVNVVQVKKEMHLSIRTYERGVENETLSCGTGVTAAALTYLSKYWHVKDLGKFTVTVESQGGTLTVSGTNVEGTYSDIKLMGAAELVFEGSITV